MNFHNKWRAFLAESPEQQLTEEELALIGEGRGYGKPGDDVTKQM